MANVIGVPRSKGNSESMIGVKLYKQADTAWAGYFEGQAVFGGDEEETTVHPTFGDQGLGATGNLIGWIFDINRKAGTATLIRAAEDVALPAVAGHALEAGVNVKIDLATGKIAAAADAAARYTNGYVVSPNGDAVDGKTGAAVANCVRVRFGALEDLGVDTP